MPNDADPQRAEWVRASIKGWSRELIDLDHRNSLINFRQSTNTGQRRKTASLDLTNSAPEALARLGNGLSVTLRSLFDSDELLGDAVARTRLISRKIVGFREEQGIEVGRLAFGFITARMKRPKGTKAPLPLRAPMLLRSVDLAARTTTESDFTVTPGPEVELNPVLPHVLQREYGLTLDPDALDALAEKINEMVADLADPQERLHHAYQTLEEVARQHELQLDLQPATVIGLFNYQKLPMVRDLESATELLIGHDLIAAMAKHPASLRDVHHSSNSFTPAPPDSLPPEEEFLVQDADSSQQEVIDLAAAGYHVLIEGPPGTGKSQTIANLIADAAARGKSVLFVAEKNAAIDAVTARLARADLADLVLEHSGGPAGRTRIAAQLAESLDQLAQQPPVDMRELHRDLADRRERLAGYAREWHHKRAPWNYSAQQACDELLKLGDVYRTHRVVRGAALARLDAETRQRAEERLREFIELGGMRVLRRETPWWRSQPSRAEIPDVLAQLDELAAGGLQQGQREMARLVSAVGLPTPDGVWSWGRTLSLLDGVATSVGRFDAELFDDRLDQLWVATAPSQRRMGAAPAMSWWTRWRLTREVRARCTSGLTRRAELHAALDDARNQRDQWAALAGLDRPPSPATDLEQVSVTYERVRTQLAAVALSAQLPDLAEQGTDELDKQLRALRDDQRTLELMPDILVRHQELEDLGLTDLLAEMTERDATEPAGLTPERAGLMLRHAWLRGLYEHIRLTSHYLNTITPEQHDRLVREFQQADRDHRESTSARIKRQLARRVREVRDAHPEQTKLLLREASKKRRQIPTRRLVEQTTDVLLTLRPCWAMSPLVVSQTLPAATLFDLVIFDEASQIRPHDAITSIMRGRRLVVAGDQHQLPPTNFFDRQISDLGPAPDAGQGGSYDEADDDDLTDYESILDSLRPVIPHRRLRWHYRSRDERLIAFSNEEIYKRSLVTFPGASQENPLRLELVEATVSPGTGGMPDEEVHHLVDLVLKHAQRQPEMSLGVITLGSRHRDRVDGAIQQARADKPELDDFFAQDSGPGQRFFVKNIENVQGDERDAIILSVGVAPGVDGRVSRTAFGPLNQPIGRRRLNVALTRASRQLTVVSAIRSTALQPWDVENGTELLRRFLEMAERGVDPSGVGRAEDRELNGFEQDVLRRLSEAGIVTHPQWGVSNHTIDFALAHPSEPGRLVLAVEADGDTYHRGASARDRDRLRQEHLERLGWRFHRVWASAWYADPVRETARIVEVWQAAAAESDQARDAQQWASASEGSPGMTVAGRATSTGHPTAPPRRLVTVTPLPEPTGRDRGRRPAVVPGRPINEYTDRQLIDLCVWLMRDGLQLDTSQRVDQAIVEMGFRRRGARIIARLTDAVRIAQQHTDRLED